MDVARGGTGTKALSMPSIDKRQRAHGAGGLSRRTYLKAVAATAQGALLGALHAHPAAAQVSGQAGPPSGTFRIWISAYFPVTGDAMWKAAFDSFQAKNPGLKLDIGEGAVRGDAEVLAKVTTTVAAGDPEDVLHVGGVFTPDYARQGMIRSLDPYYANSTLLQKTDLYPSWLSDSVYQGENYALNFAGDSRLLYLNKQAWLKAGMNTQQPPRKWDELEDAVKRLTQRGPNGEITTLGFNPSSVAWWWWIWQLGGEVLDATGEKVVLDRGDAAVKALELIMRLYNAQGGRQAFTAFQLSLGATEAASGNPSAGDYLSGFERGLVSTFLNTYSTRSEQMRPQGFMDDQWDFAGIPLPPLGRQVNWGGSHAFAITALAKNPDAGWAWLEHFSLPENDLAFAVHYDRIPMRPATAASDDYLRGDPFLAHQVEQAWYRRFLPAVPGLSEILPIWNRPVAEVYTGQKGPRDAVAQVARDMQVALDRALGKLR